LSGIFWQVIIIVFRPETKLQPIVSLSTSHTLSQEHRGVIKTPETVVNRPEDKGSSSRRACRCPSSSLSVPPDPQSVPKISHATSKSTEAF